MSSDLKSLRELIMSRETVTSDDLVRIIDALESSTEETISESRRYADEKVKALDDRLKRVEPVMPTKPISQGEVEHFEP